VLNRRSSREFPQWFRPASRARCGGRQRLRVADPTAFSESSLHLDEPPGRTRQRGRPRPGLAAGSNHGGGADSYGPPDLSELGARPVQGPSVGGAVGADRQWHEDDQDASEPGEGFPPGVGYRPAQGQRAHGVDDEGDGLVAGEGL